MSDWKLNYVKWDVVSHFKKHLMDFYEKVNLPPREEVLREDGMLLQSLRHMLPTKTHEMSIDDYIKIREGTGELESIALSFDYDPERAIEFVRSMLKQGHMFGGNERFYENSFYTYLIGYAHDVYPHLVFGKDELTFAMGFYDKQVESKRVFGEWYERLWLEATVFHNLPMDGNVWRFDVSSMKHMVDIKNGLGTIGDVIDKHLGFCYSFDKSRKYHFISSEELREALFNIVDIRKEWIKNVVK